MYIIRFHIFSATICHSASDITLPVSEPPELPIWCRRSTNPNSISRSVTCWLQGFWAWLYALRYPNTMGYWSRKRIRSSSKSDRCFRLEGVGGGMLWWGGSNCQWQPHSSPRSDLESVLTPCFRPAVTLGWSCPPPSVCHRPPLWSPSITPRRVPSCFDNTVESTHKQRRCLETPQEVVKFFELLTGYH